MMRQLLLEWLNIASDREQRRFLEAHPELLSPQHERALKRYLTRQAKQEALSQRQLTAPYLLRDARLRGGSIEAIREAYVNVRGGMTCDIPAWLERVEGRLSKLETLEQREATLWEHQTAWKRVKLLRAAIKRAEKTQIAPAIIAELQRKLWSALDDTTDVNRRPIEEEEIACLEAVHQVYTHERYPVRWATIHHNLSYTYYARIGGEKRENMERTIAHLRAALEVFTAKDFLIHYGASYNNLGNAYRGRIEGKPSENIEQAIACYREAMRVYARDTFPHDYARALDNLGETHIYRLLGVRRANREQAITFLQEALQIYTREDAPIQYARVQANLGTAYVQRVAGDRVENLEQAIACFNEALRVWTREDFPILSALTTQYLAEAYSERITGSRQKNLEEAIRLCQEALAISTLEAFPAQHRDTQLIRAEAEASLACWLEARQYEHEAVPHWVEAGDAYHQAHLAEDILLALGAGVSAQDAVLQKGRDAPARHGFALLSLGRVEEAAVAIEAGRARVLAQAQALDTANPQRIGNQDRRDRYIAARNRFIDAQRVLQATLSADLDEETQRRMELEQSQEYRQARAALDAVVEEVRAASDPSDFMNLAPDAAAILRAAACGGSGHALVYLAATPWGGYSIAAFSDPARFEALPLPDLTDALAQDLIEVRLDDEAEHLIGGFDAAQQCSAFDLLATWPGASFQERAAALHAGCAAGQSGALDAAAQEMLAIPALARLMAQPIASLNPRDSALLAGLLHYGLLSRELRRCLDQLAAVALRPLIDWLSERGVASLTLIPCGALATFPLGAAPIDDRQAVRDVLPMSIAPSARSLLRAEQGAGQRAGVYALGNTRPASAPLPWSEAEALSIAGLAAQAGLPFQAQAQEQATRDWLIAALQHGQVVDVCCHGFFDREAVLQSRLLLARQEELRLGELLSHRADLYGLRLLILSACQTAMLDLQGARDEVRSLAAGMLQAGARAVLGALWPVDDRATFFLTVRFAQEWLPHLNASTSDHSPAAALGRAQAWLRSATNRDLQAWLKTLPYQGAPGGAAPALARMQPRLVALRGHRRRLMPTRGLISSGSLAAPDARPYSDPAYWAGFQIIGW